MKHAYLILAHNEFEVLNRLLQAIDDERNDIYIHWDKKLENPPILQVKNANLFILKNCVDVRWGDLSVVEGEYALFEEACKHGGYDYYHLLSGVDMPLKSQNYIHDFFEKNQGKEFIGFYVGDCDKQVERKVQRYHLFPKSFGKNEGITLKRMLRSGFLLLQDVLKIKRNKNIFFKKGTQWVSLTHNFVEYMLQEKANVCKTYHHTFCSDEIFVQTLCWNSSFKNKVFDYTSEGRGCMRMIGWKDGELYPWTEIDYDALMNSEAIFARKFTGKHLEVVDRILSAIENE